MKEDAVEAELKDGMLRIRIPYRDPENSDNIKTIKIA
jgi:HSP20 family molecular chaperone IbpA